MSVRSRFSTFRSYAVMASGTGLGESGVIDVTICVTGVCYETGGAVVAIATFLCGSDVKRRLACGDGAIMTITTVAEYFCVVHRAGNSKT